MAERPEADGVGRSDGELSADYISTLDPDPRMTLYQQREEDFLEFVKQSNSTVEIDSGTDVRSAEDMPLSGLQCLLTLTEILDRAAQLRVANFDLEQRIEILQKFKLLAEVQHDLHNATLNVDLNSNGLVKHKKSKGVTSSWQDDTDSKLVRAHSVESLDGYHRSKLHSSDEELIRQSRPGTIKGSKLSETWGKMKVKLAHKENNSNTLMGTNKGSKRHKSADGPPTMGSFTTIGPCIVDCSSDLAGSTGLSTVSPGDGTVPGTPNTAPVVLFTQREIQITTQGSAADADYGGVWLGDDDDDSETKNALDQLQSAADYGGVWLGPPAAGVPPKSPVEAGQGGVNSNTQQIQEKETLERKVSEPMGHSLTFESTDVPKKLSLDDLSQKHLAASLDELSLRSPNKELSCASPTPPRKKSSTKFLGQTVLRLSGSELKRSKAKDSTDNLPKDFKRKMEEWQSMKDNHESTADESSSIPKSRKNSATAAKAKTQRIKNKKRSGILKMRSKSAERIEEMDGNQRHSDDFEEKLREWSVKQGHHPSYYSEIRDSAGSSDGHQSRQGRHENNKGLSRQAYGDARSESSILVSQKPTSNTQRAASAGCLPPLPPEQSFRSTEEFGSLREMSQSSDTVFSSSSLHSPRKLSRSEEAINTVITDVEETDHQQSATDSNIDLYARASDESLEKHLSLFAVNSMTSINMSSYPGFPPHPIIKSPIAGRAKGKDNLKHALAIDNSTAPTLALNTDIFYDQRMRSDSSEGQVINSPGQRNEQEFIKYKKEELTTADKANNQSNAKALSPKLHRQTGESSTNVVSNSRHPVMADLTGRPMFYVPHKTEHKLSAKISDTSFPPQSLPLKSPREGQTLPEFSIEMAEDEESTDEMLLDDPFQAGRLSNASSYTKIPGSSPSAPNSPKLMHSPSPIDRTQSETSTISSGSNFIANIDDTLTLSSTRNKLGSLTDDALDQELITNVLNNQKSIPDVVTIDSDVPCFTKEFHFDLLPTDDDDDIADAANGSVDQENLYAGNDSNTVSAISSDKSNIESEDLSALVLDSGSRKSEGNCVENPVRDEIIGEFDSYDINSNLTVHENSSSQSEPSLGEYDIEVPQASIDSSLKMRLKSLAMEYETEGSNHKEPKTQHMGKAIHRYGSPVIHKRARSHDFISTSNLSSNVLLRKSSSTDKEKTFKNNSINRGGGVTTAKSNGSTANQFLPSISTNVQRSNVHRLKSADELIYEHSPNTNRKHYNRAVRSDGMQYSRFDFVNRREWSEQPKSGAVEKTRSLFVNGGMFKNHFGTDYNRPQRQILQ